VGRTSLPKGRLQGALYCGLQDEDKKTTLPKDNVV